jgi:hypothetical protein
MCLPVPLVTLVPTSPERARDRQADVPGFAVVIRKHDADHDGPPRRPDRNRSRNQLVPSRRVCIGIADDRVRQGERAASMQCAGDSNDAALRHDRFLQAMG